MDEHHASGAATRSDHRRSAAPHLAAIFASLKEQIWKLQFSNEATSADPYSQYYVRVSQRLEMKISETNVERPFC